MSKIYTKTGDKGTSGLYDGNRVGKGEIIFEVLGDIDELSSHIGLLFSLVMKINNNGILFTNNTNNTWDYKSLKTIQKTLQNIASEIATIDRTNRNIPELTSTHIQDLEVQIDKMGESLPKLTHFILQGITQSDAQAHVCRSVCRRLERHLWKYNSTAPYCRNNILTGNLSDPSEKTNVVLKNINVNSYILVYINRLSDYFFQLARYLCIVAENNREFR